jgi:hypothetical protein
MSKINFKLAFLSTILCLGVAGVANASSSSGLILEGGLHFGGDRLQTVYTSNGTSEVKAGGGLSFGIGIGVDLAPDMESRITFGVKRDGVFGSNGEVTFTRYPIDVLILKKLDGWKLGGGVTYHLNPEYADTIYPAIYDKYDDALGFLLELDRDLGLVYVGGRVTVIDYKITNTSINKSGNSFSLVGGIRF